MADTKKNEKEQEQGASTGDKPEQQPVVVIEHPTLREALLYSMIERPPLEKAAKVDFTTKDGRRVKYDYADLGTMRRLTDPSLNRHGLYVTDETEYEDDKEFQVSTLIHVHSDEMKMTKIEVTMGGSDMKDLAANKTYAKRYNYADLTGRVAEEDYDGKDVNRKGKDQNRQQGSQEGKQQDSKSNKDKGPQTAKAKALKITYFPFLNKNKIFANDDERHTWQATWMGMHSTEQWKTTDVPKAIGLLQWRMEVGAEESDKLMEFLNTKAKSVRGLVKVFLQVMDVKKVTGIQDVMHWRIAMTAAKLTIDHKMEAATDMGKALVRAAVHEGMVEQFLSLCEVKKLGDLNKETVIKWDELLAEAVGQWNDMPDREVKIPVDTIISGQEEIEM